MKGTETGTETDTSGTDAHGHLNFETTTKCAANKKEKANRGRVAPLARACTARSLSMIVNSLLAHLEQSVDLEAREQMLPRQMGKSRERMSNGSFTSLSCSGAEISEGGDSGTALCVVLQAYTSKRSRPDENSCWQDGNCRAPLPIHTNCITILRALVLRAKSTTLDWLQCRWPSLR